MKPFQDNTPHLALTTIEQVIRWQVELRLLHARLASCFARPEPYARALRYLQAILSTAERKNSWQIAEQAHEATPYGMQRLLSQAVWDANGVRDAIRTFLLQLMAGRQLIIAIDETGMLKRGKHSAGVGKQHYGPTGDVRNCQVGVFLSLVTPVGHALIDRELYLLPAWTDDPARRASVGIPDHVPFRTKPQLAQLMLERLWQAHLHIDWVVADCVYGDHPGLREHLHARQQPYVLAVSCDHMVVAAIPSLGVRYLTVGALPALLSPSDWQRLSMSQGSKGPRLFDWACLPTWQRNGDDAWHSILLRRCVDDPSQITFYLAFAPPGTSLQAKVTALGARWRIEEDFRTGKQLGLDHYEVRSWLGWYRHITLVMLALAFLTSIALAVTSTVADPLPPPVFPVPTASVVAAPLCPLSLLEARRVLARLLFPPPSSIHFVLAWSAFRRQHQFRARLSHSRRRLKAG